MAALGGTLSSPMPVTPETERKPDCVVYIFNLSPSELRKRLTQQNIYEERGLEL